MTMFPPIRTALFFVMLGLVLVLIRGIDGTDIARSLQQPVLQPKSTTPPEGVVDFVQAPAIDTTLNVAAGQTSPIPDVPPKPVVEAPQVTIASDALMSEPAPTDSMDGAAPQNDAVEATPAHEADPSAYLGDQDGEDVGQLRFVGMTSDRVMQLLASGHMGLWIETSTNRRYWLIPSATRETKTLEDLLAQSRLVEESATVGIPARQENGKFLRELPISPDFQGLPYYWLQDLVQDQVGYVRVNAAGLRVSQAFDTESISAQLVALDQIAETHPSQSISPHGLTMFGCWRANNQFAIEVVTSSDGSTVLLQNKVCNS